MKKHIISLLHSLVIILTVASIFILFWAPDPNDYISADKQHEYELMLQRYKEMPVYKMTGKPQQVYRPQPIIILPNGDWTTTRPKGWVFPWGKLVH